MKNLLLADRQVGNEIAKWLFDNYRHDVALLVSPDPEIIRLSNSYEVPAVTWENEKSLVEYISLENLEFELGIMAWWPYIIKPSMINIPKRGFINTHPSLLPYNRGKNPNFWSIVDQTPFGVTIHKVSVGVDDGPILAQSEILYDWTDTGATLYEKATSSIVDLFQNLYPRLRESEVSCVEQNDEISTFHRSSDLEPACEIDLNKYYLARSLLNLLRARTFQGYPSCWFKDESGQDYEVRIEIRKK